MSSMVRTLVPRLRASCDAVARHLPAADAELDQIGCRHVRQIGRPDTRAWCASARRDPFLDVDVAVEMDDADPLRRALRDAAHAREADGMIAAEHQRQRAGRKDVGDAAGDLVEALLQIGGNGEHVAGVAQRHLLAQIDAELVIVGRIERRDAANALRAEARPGPIGRAGIERYADHRGVIFGRRRARSRHRAP